MNKLSSTEAAYIAGIIDGEGWITFMGNSWARTSHKDRRTPLVGISNSDLPMLSWVLLKIGDGKIKECPHKNAKPHWKKQYRYIIMGKKVGELLKQIFQYLVIKQHKAQIVMEYCDTIILEPTNIALPQTVWDRRTELVNSLLPINNK